MWEKNVTLIEKNFWNLGLKAENLQTFEITRAIYSNGERSEIFWWPNAFLTFFAIFGPDIYFILNINFNDYVRFLQDYSSLDGFDSRLTK